MKCTFSGAVKILSDQKDYIRRCLQYEFRDDRIETVIVSLFVQRACVMSSVDTVRHGRRLTRVWKLN